MGREGQKHTEHPLWKSKERAYRKPHWQNQTDFPDHVLNHRMRTIRYLVCGGIDSEAERIGFRILDCKKSSPCHSPFCPICRQEMQEVAADKVLQQFGSTPTENLRFLTILLPISPPSPTLVRDQISECRKSLRNFFDYHGYDEVRLYGAFEIDVKTRKLSVTSYRSRQVLKALGMDVSGGNYRSPDEPYYLPHLHAIVDIRSHDDVLMKKRLKNVFNQPYQVRMTRLQSQKSKSRNLKDMAGYMFKFRTQFADNLFGKEQGLRAKYGTFYPPEVLKPFVRLVHGLMNGSKVNGLEMRYGLNNRIKDGGNC